MLGFIVKEVCYLIRYFLYWLLYYHKFKHVGRHTKMGRPLVLKDVKSVSIGDHVFIMKGVRIETFSKYNEKHYEPEITIGNNVSIAQYVEIVANEKLIIEDDVAIGQFTMINTNVHGYTQKDVPILKQDLVSAPIRIGEGTAIGMGACILPGADIGKYCYIGANTVINKKVPDYTIVSPARPRMATLPYAEDNNKC